MAGTNQHGVDCEKAFEYFKKEEQKNKLARFLLHFGPPAKAIGKIRRYAANENYLQNGEEEYALACYLAGMMVSGEEKFDLLTKSMQFGFPLAHGELALCYSHGTGCVVDKVAAERHFKIGASHKDGRALFGLFSHWTGRPEKHAESIALLHEASDQGWTSAHCKLGELYFHGRYVKRSLPMVIKYGSRFAKAVGFVSQRLRSVLFDVQKKKAKDLPLLCMELGKAFYWDLSPAMFENDFQLDSLKPFIEQCRIFYCQVLDDIQYAVILCIWVSRRFLGHDVTQIIAKKLWATRKERIWFKHKELFY